MTLKRASIDFRGLERRGGLRAIKVLHPLSMSARGSICRDQVFRWTGKPAGWRPSSLILRRCHRQFVELHSIWSIRGAQRSERWPRSSHLSFFLNFEDGCFRTKKEHSYFR